MHKCSVFLSVGAEGFVSQTKRPDRSLFKAAFRCRAQRAQKKLLVFPISGSDRITAEHPEAELSEIRHGVPSRTTAQGGWMELVLLPVWNLKQRWTLDYQGSLTDRMGLVEQGQFTLYEVPLLHRF